MKSRVTLLRITYWWGMLADLFESIRMSMPKLFIKTSGATLAENPELTNGLLYGVPVMLGWTIVLFWADRKPLERKGILLCLVPVIISYMVIQGIGIASNVYSISKMIPTYILQTILLSLAVYSYFANRKANV